MAMIRTPESNPLKRHQEMYKGRTPPWKEVFREKCFQRLRNSRSRLVDQFRGLDEQPNCEDITTLMEDEWSNFCSQQDLLPSLYKGPIDDKALDDHEVDVIISFMDQVQKELVEEEKRILAEHYSNLESCTLESEVNWLEQDEVICPLCKKFSLSQDQSVIFCKCGMRINTEQDGLTLMHLKTQLYQGLDSHDVNCSSSPTFSLISLTDVTNLVIVCDMCCFMYIVI